MGLFGRRRPAPPSPFAIKVPSRIPMDQIDTDKRYDVYCEVHGEERLYENVRFVGARTFDAISEFSSPTTTGFLEIEAVDGTRALIKFFGICLICDHGAQPAYRVTRLWGES